MTSRITIAQYTQAQAYLEKFVNAGVPKDDQNFVQLLQIISKYDIQKVNDLIDEVRQWLNSENMDLNKSSSPCGAIEKHLQVKKEHKLTVQKMSSNDWKEIVAKHAKQNPDNITVMGQFPFYFWALVQNETTPQYKKGEIVSGQYNQVTNDFTYD